MDASWYRPVCDTVLAKIQKWHDMYERGDESASRPYVTKNARIVDLTTMYAHKLRFKTVEIDHLVRLIDALCEHKELASDFRRIRAAMKNGRLYPGGDYEVTLNFYKQDIVEILDALKRAKSGKLKTIEQIANEQQESGKGMFEL